MNDFESIRISLYLPAQLVIKIDEAAKQIYMSRTGLVREVMNQYCQQHLGDGNQIEKLRDQELEDFLKDYNERNN